MVEPRKSLVAVGVLVVLSAMAGYHYTLLSRPDTNGPSLAGSGSPGAGPSEPTLFTELIADHDDLRWTLSRLNMAEDPAPRSELQDQLQRAFGSHLKAEEATLYWALHSDPEGQELATQGQREHAGIMTILTLMKGLAVTSAEWRGQLALLKERLTSHLEQEETDLFPYAQAHLSAEQLKALHTRFLQLKSSPQ